jgi:hypothetical protein
MPEAHITKEQLAELAQSLRPVIAQGLEESVADTTVAITCTPVVGDPDGAAVLSFEVRVRGQNISPEQEEDVAKLLRTSGVGQIVKRKSQPPV